MPSEKTNAFNRGRVLWCCEHLNVTVETLAAKAGIPHATLTRALHEDGSLTIIQLENIGKYLHRPLLFFFEEGMVDEARADSPQFRTINSQKPELAHNVKILIKRVEEQRQVFVDLLEDDEDFMSTNWIQNRIQKERRETIKSFAQRVREWLGLGDRNTFETYRAALEKAGVLVFVTNPYKGNWQIEKESPIRGFSLYFENYPVIVAKKQENPFAQSFTLMHELAHLLLHRMSFIDEERDFRTYVGQEREVNEFAGHLLVPDYLLNQIDLAQFPFDSVQEFDEYLSDQRKTWAVSGDVIIRRLHDAGYLPQHLYQEYADYKIAIPRNVQSGESKAMRYRDLEPLKIFGRSFVGVVLGALHNEQITTNKASKYLDNLKVNDLRKLEKRLVFN